MRNTVIHWDSLEVLKTLEDNSIDSIVSDPPYWISFMGKKWDYDVPSVELWKEAMRVLKPGGHALVACGTRTQHRMAVNLEDAGFEIRDIVAWVYGSGFPKSLAIWKAINKLETNEWSNIWKSLDILEKKDILEIWKNNSNNVSIVETQYWKNQIETGMNMQKKDTVPENVMQNDSQENWLSNVFFVEANLQGLQHLPVEINTVLMNVDAEIRQ